MPAPLPSQQHVETYRGRQIDVVAYEERRGAWSYTWVVDGLTTGRSARGAMLRTAEAALKRGTLAARLAVDRAA